MTRTKFSIALVLLACSCRIAPPLPNADRSPSAIERFDRPADRTITAGDTELSIWYFQRGSRSEGQHGELRIDGERIPPAALGEMKPSALGTLRWFGDERPVLWAVSGWHFDDETQRLSSWQLESKEPETP